MSLEIWYELDTVTHGPDGYWHEIRRTPCNWEVAASKEAIDLSRSLGGKEELLDSKRISTSPDRLERLVFYQFDADAPAEPDETQKA